MQDTVVTVVSSEAKCRERKSLSPENELDAEIYSLKVQHRVFCRPSSIIESDEQSVKPVVTCVASVYCHSRHPDRAMTKAV